MFNLVLITGISGSGKSVALRVLEDVGYICVDNLPVKFLHDFIADSRESGLKRIAIAMDVRSPGDLNDLPYVLTSLRSMGVNLRVIFLDANDHTLIQRYSESRRRHPLTERLQQNGKSPSLRQCIDVERDMLNTLRQQEHTIDTTGLTPGQLRAWVLDIVQTDRLPIILTFESFAYKRGVPGDADLVFDVRCLPNPHYDSALRDQTGRDPAVAQWLNQHEIVQALIKDIEKFIKRWLPEYAKDTRNYLTVALGCTGGKHRSVYVAEQLAKIFCDNKPLLRHRNQPQFHD